MPRGIDAKSLSKAARQLRSEAAKLINFINNCNERIIVVGRDCYPDNKKLAVCTAVITVGWAYLPNSETKNISIIEVMQGFSLLGRADCLLRAEEAHGGVEPTEHSVDPLNANNQAELERGVKQDNNHSTLIFELGMNVVTEGVALAVCSICSLSGLVALRPSANPLFPWRGVFICQTTS